MVDDNLVTSLIYSCSIGVIVSSFYLILWLTRGEKSRRQSYLLLSASYVFYAVRVASHLFLYTELPLVEAFNEFLYICWVWTLCMGVYVYRGRRALNGRCFIWPGLMSAWVAFGQIADLSFFVRTLPLHIVGAAYFWFAAALVWRWRQERQNQAFVALTVMLWAHGLVTLVTPFTRETWLGPYGFTLLSILGLSTGMALMLIALFEEEDEIRRYKDHLEDAVRQRTEELRHARDAADAANKAKSVFLANMSHELRTPLNSILGFSTMMRREPGLNASQQENLDIINRSGEHLLKLINDVLEVAKIEAGRLKLDVAPFDLGAMVRDVADMMGQRALERGLYLEVDQSSAFPRYIKGDEARLRQILVNLVGNAVKFTQVGGVIIRLGVRRNARERLRIEIEDTGPGLREEELKRLFQPFSQFTRVGVQRGTGLGLAITRQFVELMGGAINVRSMVGKGSVFRVELPLEPVTEAELKALPAAALKREIVGLAPGQPTYRILIAEDQIDNRLLLERMMTSIGLETKTAINGADCIRLFLEWRPHLIWMDRRMPVMDGIEATRRIRLLPGGDAVRIVAVTASAFKEERKALFDAGIDDIVRKPYHPYEIYDCLARRLGLEYVYAAAAHDEDGSLTPEMLAALPGELRHDLREALESLDANTIKKVIDEVGAIDARLARVLAQRAENFDYPTILHALNPCAQ